MSVGNLLVLRGGTSSDKAADWPPLDDYQAPHRAPKLAASLEDAAKIAAKFPSLAVVVPPPFQEDQLQAPINQELKVNNRKPRRFTNNINKVLYQHNDVSNLSVGAVLEKTGQLAGWHTGCIINVAINFVSS